METLKQLSSLDSVDGNEILSWKSTSRSARCCILMWRKAGTEHNCELYVGTIIWKDSSSYREKDLDKVKLIYIDIKALKLIHFNYYTVNFVSY